MFKKKDPQFLSLDSQSPAESSSDFPMIQCYSFVSLSSELSNVTNMSLMYSEDINSYVIRKVFSLNTK